MMRIPTYLAKSNIHGIGVFAREPVHSGTVVWSYTPGFDVIITPSALHTLSEVQRAFVEMYGWPSISEEGGTVLACDNGRFFNHSDKPNCRSDYWGYPTKEVTTVAITDIAADEELTDYYPSFGADAPWL